jgi:hypothetical protein
MIRDKKKFFTLFLALTLVYQGVCASSLWDFPLNLKPQDTTSNISWDFSASSELQNLYVSEKKDYNNFFFIQDSSGNLFLGEEDATISHDYTLKPSIYSLLPQLHIDLLENYFFNFTLAYGVSQKSRNVFERKSSYNGNATEVPSGERVSLSHLSNQNPSLFPKSQTASLKNRIREYKINASWGKSFHLSPTWKIKTSIGYFFERMKFSYHKLLPFQSINSHGPSVSLEIEKIINSYFTINAFSQLKLASTSFGHFTSSLLPKTPSPIAEAGVKLSFNSLDKPLNVGLKLQYSKSQELKAQRIGKLYDASLLRYLPIKSDFSIVRKNSRVELSIEKVV